MAQGIKYATDEERRDARNLQSREYYRNHKNEHHRRVRDWHERNPAARNEYLLRSKYGITPEQYNEMWVAQEGKCAVCGKVPSGRWGKRLCVDHDHRTGRVRGLVCSPCNRAIGQLGDDVEGVKRALEYLERAAVKPEVSNG